MCAARKHASCTIAPLMGVLMLLPYIRFPHGKQTVEFTFVFFIKLVRTLMYQTMDLL